MIKIESLNHFIELLAFGEMKVLYVKTGEKFRQLMFVEIKDGKLKIIRSEGSKKEIIKVEDLKMVKEHNLLSEIERNSLFVKGN